MRIQRPEKECQIWEVERRERGDVGSEHEKKVRHEITRNERKQKLSRERGKRLRGKTSSKLAINGYTQGSGKRGGARKRAKWGRKAGAV